MVIKCFYGCTYLHVCISINNSDHMHALTNFLREEKVEKLYSSNRFLIIMTAGVSMLLKIRMDTPVKLYRFYHYFFGQN